MLPTIGQQRGNRRRWSRSNKSFVRSLLESLSRPITHRSPRTLANTRKTRRLPTTGIRGPSRRSSLGPRTKRPNHRPEPRANPPGFVGHASYRITSNDFSLTRTRRSLGNLPTFRENLPARSSKRTKTKRWLNLAATETGSSRTPRETQLYRLDTTFLGN